MSLMSCSINKLKSHMLFTCNNFTKKEYVFRFNVEKKFWLQKMVGGGGGGGVGGGPRPPPFLYSPGFFCLIFLDKLHFIALFDIIFFVVATQQALSWPFNRKAFLKSLFRSFCFLSTSHAIRFNMT